MALENNTTCDICGKKYHVCKTCKSIKSFQPWRTVTDTLQHYMIYLVLSEYTKTRNKDVARAELLNCDLTGREFFNDNIKKVVDEILSDPEVLEDVEPVIEESTVVEQEVKTETVQDDVIAVKNNTKKKRAAKQADESDDNE